MAQQWTASRHAGRSLAAIAEEYGTTIGKVRASTRPFGPFRPPGPRLPDGVVGVKGLAQMAWVSHPTAARWVRTGRTPAPDFVTATGRTVWQAATIAAWLRDSDFAHCPDCGARCVSLSWHRAQAHRA
ncbi:MAG: hypothetical protein IE926_09835 [Micrococcales bacterium]|nr:hypothetical protein [Micrococcales bacterium]